MSSFEYPSNLPAKWKLVYSMWQVTLCLILNTFPRHANSTLNSRYCKQLNLAVDELNKRGSGFVFDHLADYTLVKTQ